MAMSNFVAAERYIQLKRIFAPKLWSEKMSRINELILTPLIALFYLFLYGFDFLSVVPPILNTYRSWNDFLEYNRLRFHVQSMYLKTFQVGGPFIVTNDPEYLPYVFADAVTRHDMRHLHSEKARH